LAGAGSLASGFGQANAAKKANEDAIEAQRVSDFFNDIRAREVRGKERADGTISSILPEFFNTDFGGSLEANIAGLLSNRFFGNQGLERVQTGSEFIPFARGESVINEAHRNDFQRLLRQVLPSATPEERRAFHRGEITLDGFRRAPGLGSFEIEVPTFEDRQITGEGGGPTDAQRLVEFVRQQQNTLQPAFEQGTQLLLFLHLDSPYKRKSSRAIASH